LSVYETDVNYPYVHTTTFSWDEVPQTSLTGEPYYFFVKEVEKSGNEYVDFTPPQYIKSEDGTDVYNTYWATGSFTPQVTKVLDGGGRKLKAGEFEFELYDDLGTIKTVTNDADGNVIFAFDSAHDDFDFTSYDSYDIGEDYTFFIREKVPATPEGGMTYDPMVVTVTVSIADSGNNDGTLSITAEYASNNPLSPTDTEFNNIYRATGKLPAESQKTKKVLVGRDLQAGEFSFELRKVGVEGVLQTVQNDANGIITFNYLDQFSFTQEDIGNTYQYTVQEVTPSNPEMGMDYDKCILRYLGTVVDEGDGILTVTRTFEPIEGQTNEWFTNTFTPMPSAIITKVARQKNFTAPGTVTYDYTVINTGNVPLTNVVLTDNKIPSVTLGQTELAVGEKVTVTGTFDVTQAHIDAGESIVNVATLTAKAGQVDLEKTASETVTITQTPRASITKVADRDAVAAPGTVNYTYTVKNTGNVTLTEVALTDNKIPSVTLGQTELAVGEEVTVTGTYDVTQAHIDAGESIVNVATLTANQNIPVTQASKTVTITQTPSASITKEADITIFTVPGRVTYTYKVKNTGNMTLTEVALTDNKLPSVTLGQTELAVGESVTVYGTYDVTQTDITNGEPIVNIATLTAKQNIPVTQASETVSVKQEPNVSISKVANQKAFVAPGIVTYTYTVRNTGNVPLTNVVLTDNKIPSVMLGQTELAVGEKVTVTGTYNVTQAHIDAGESIVNVATLTAKAGQVNLEKTASETVTIAQTPRASITKVADRDAVAAPGTVNYTYTVKNTGNVTLTEVALTDNKIPSVTLGKTKLAVGEEVTVTGTYDVTQAHIDAGESIVNVATLTANQNIPVTQASKTVTITQTPSASITKVADQEAVATPGTVNYTYTVKNTGNVTLTEVTLTDNKIPLVTLGQTELAVGEEVTVTGTYDVTQAHIDAGESIVNVATLTANQNIPVTQASKTVTIEQKPNASIIKIADPKVFSKPGTVTYTYTVKNTGNVTLTNVTLSDNKIDTVSLGQKTKLEVGEEVTVTKTVDVTQAHIDAGESIVNVATLTAKTPNQDPLTKTTTETISFNQTPGLTISKSAQETTYSEVGDEITYTVKIKNTGNVSLTGIVVADPMVASMPNPTGDSNNPGTLDVGETWTYTYTYSVKQSDIDDGKVENTASVKTNEVTVPVEASQEVFATQKPKLSVTKSADTTTYSTAGETITYTVEVENTGNVSLKDIVVTDPMVASMPNPTGEGVGTGTLGVGKTWTYTYTYTVKQSDIDVGSVENTVTAKSNLTAPLTSSVKVTAAQDPKLTVNKRRVSINGDTTLTEISKAGDVITYAVEVENTGNLTLMGIVFNDSLDGISTPVLVENVNPADNILQVGEIWTYTYTYTVKQSDIDNGGVENIAKAMSDNTPYLNSSVTVPAAQTPILTLSKSADRTTCDEVGNVIKYTVELTNDGNVTIRNARIDDNMAGLTNVRYKHVAANNTEIPVINGSVTLLPDEKLVLTAEYAVTQADLDAGKVLNSATGGGKAPNPAAPANPISVVPGGSGEASVPANQMRKLTLSKSAEQTTYAAVGDVLTYSIELKNEGNVTISNAEITDNKTGLTNISYKHVAVDDTETGATNGAATLLPGEKLVLTAEYAVTQADLDAGKVLNSATGGGEAPNPAAPANPISVVPGGSGEASVPANQMRKLTLSKSAEQTTYAAVGDVLTYSIELKNEGNVTISNAEITDNKTGLTNISYKHVAVDDTETGATNGAATLLPGEKLVMTAEYAVTQADLDAGKVLNSATGGGKAPNPAAPANPISVVPGGSGEASVSANQMRKLTLSKSAEQTTYAAVGDVLTYSIELKNEGNVTISNAEIIDNKPGLKDISYKHVDVNNTETSATNGAATLLPGEKLVMTADYAVTQADLDAGKVQNSATGGGKAPNPAAPANPISVVPGGSGEASVPANQTRKLMLSKSADQTTYAAVGDVLTYSVELKNEGNVTISNAEIIDNKPGLKDISYKHVDVNNTETSATNGAATLLPGEKLVMTAEYAVTQADLDAGKVQNSATGSGKGPNPDDPTQPVSVVPDAPGEATVPATQTPKLTLSKSANQATYTKAGDVLTYSVELKNEGNVTISNAEITDNKTGLTNTSYKHVAVDSAETPATNGAATLLPGEKLVMTAEYAVTQADLDAGKVQNSATGGGKAPNPAAPANPISVVPGGSGEASVPANQTRKLTLSKSTDQTTYAAVGDVLTYSVELKNEGNVTISNAEITDNKTGLKDIGYKHVDVNNTETSATNGAATLLPGEKLVLTAEYAVTQADLDAGKVLNSASGSGKAPNPAEPTKPVPVVPGGSGEASVPATQTPKLTLSKNANPATYTKVDDVITYIVILTNEGNVTIDNAKITDNKAGLTNISYKHVAVNNKETLATNGAVTLLPGEKLVLTAEYAVTQEDLDAGKVLNSATGSGEAPNPADPAKPTPVEPDAPATEETAATQIPGMTVRKRQVSINGDTAQTELMSAGDKIAYEVVVTNTGNVTLTNVEVTDSLVPLMDAMRTESKTSDGKLEVGETWTYAYTYTVTQADMDAGQVRNSATSSGKAPNPDDPTKPTPVEPNIPATEETAATQLPDVTVVKNVDKSKFTNVGEELTYTIMVTNVGNVTLEDIVVTDSLVTLTADMLTESVVTDGKLEVGETWTYEYAYTVTQADMDAGYVKNVVSVAIPDFSDDPSNLLPSDETTVSGERTPGMTLVKNVDKSKFAAAGEELTYTIVVTNTGNVTLEDVVVTDSLVTLTADMLTESATADGKLEVGETWTYEYTYTVTQADVDAGYVKNAVRVASPDFPDDDLDNLLPVDEVEVHKRTYTVVKTATEDRFYKAGDVLNYMVTVTNTGMAAVEGLKIADTLVPFAEMTLVESVEDNGNLDVGEVWTLTYEYTVTEADATAGTVLNTVMATDPSNPADPEVGVNEVHKPSYAVKMTVAQNKFTKDGDGLYYTVTITNTGKVALDGLIITDALVPFERMTLVESVESNGSLDVGEVWTLRYGYTVTEADATAGKVLSAVTVTDPLDQEHPVEDEVMVEKETMLPISGVASVNVSDCYE
jgi:uncharacterized repeat protein (TIGR01451 family)